ncbi:MAG: Uma2 family endonuclease [Sandaracinaceae bacterium]
MSLPETLLADRPMTLAEWAELPENEPGELVDGRLVEDEEVGALHDVVVAWLIRVLGNWLVARDGVIGASDTRFGVSESRGRKPDLFVYLGARRPTPHGLVTEPPDLMIEVVSPRPNDARRDRLEKMAEYASFGVRYYWIVDPAVRLMEIFELGADGRYTRALGAAEGQVGEIPGCEGLMLDLDELWTAIDRLHA